jgi:crotonobetainyl-CoA:carnitine CoA-transferase CaiB-like acyl-CoA transferase
LGREDLIPLQGDLERREELRVAFQEAFLSKTRDEWFELLTQQDICVAKVNALDELESDPQLTHRQMIVEVECPETGKVKQAGISIKLSETPGEIRTPTPSLGQHTDEVLQELGYGEAQIRQLRQAGAIG